MINDPDSDSRLISDEDFLSDLGSKVVKHVSSKASETFFKAVNDGEIIFGHDYDSGAQKRQF